MPAESTPAHPQSSPEDAFQKEEFEGIQDRLAAIIQSISGRPELHVTTDIDASTRLQMEASGQDPDQQWFYQRKYDRKTGKLLNEHVHIPRHVLESAENVAKGKAAHEAAHVVSTRTREVVPDEVLQKLGFKATMAALEERPTDQLVRERREGAGLWVDEARRESWREIRPQISGAIRDGRMPKFNQLLQLCVYHNHIDDISIFAPDVLEAYQALQSDIEVFERTLPREGAREEEIIAHQKLRYAQVYKNIFPSVEKFIESDTREQELEQLLQHLQQQMDAAGAGGEPQDLESLTEEEKESLEKLLEARRPKHDEGQQEGQEPGGEPSAEAGTPGEGRLDELMRAILRKILESLPKDVRQKILDEATKELERQEDELANEHAAKLDEEKLETHEEYRERKEKEDQAQKRQKDRETEEQRIREELQKIEETHAARHESLGPYEEAYQEVREIDERLYHRLEQIFTPNIKGTVRLVSGGSKINLPAVFRRDAARYAGAASVDNRVFESVFLPEKKDYAVTQLIDLSGSMQEGGKIHATFRAAIVLSEVLNRLGVRNEILGFQDDIIVYKTFDQELTDEVRGAMAGMLLEVWNRNPRGHNCASWNDDGRCLRKASQRLAAQAGKQKFILAYSDGEPVPRWLDDSDGEEDLVAAVEEICSNTDQGLIGLGLGAHTGHVKRFYPAALADLDVHDLPEVLGDLLEDVILHPEKYKELRHKPLYDDDY